MIKTNKAAKVLLMAMILTMVFSMFSMEAYATGGTTGTQKTGIWSEFDVSLDGVTTTGTQGNAWETLLEKYQGFITGIAAVGAVTMVVLFIIQFLKLGASAGNPSARSQAMVGVLWTGLAAAGLGAVALITGIFYGAIV